MKGYPSDVTVRAVIRAKYDAWRTNTRWRVMGWLTRSLGLKPYCPCGWPLTQCFDGRWTCGSCIKAGRGYFDTTGGIQPRRRKDRWTVTKAKQDSSQPYVFTGYAGGCRGDGQELLIDCGEQGVLEISSRDNLWGFYCKNLRITIEVAPDTEGDDPADQAPLPRRGAA